MKLRNILITGGSRGIGAATARAFAAQGDRVFINYRQNRNKALALAGEIGGTAIAADVADASQVAVMLQEITHLAGGVDVLINNAGFAQFSMFDALSDTEWDRMMQVTLNGAFYCIRGVLPYMIHQKQGNIINISSMWGITGAACEVAYSTAKAGLIGMTKALAKEVGPSGIRVNCVAPGVIDTDMNASLSQDTIRSLKEETPLGRLGTPEEIADTILFLAKPDSFITGQVISPNGGLVI
ncbi:3-oxoacyl-ACP reductase FabG [Oscillospiraceae bacterium DSM 107454]|uniref:3-oxoacyl-ACP reductase FabG n=1 Tax=Ructibacterium gallinarum TaxID=2779355 RepID=A0A9D5M329_9FIRM|nr:3-oxoacyl-ACP reductase FabG [Ructibacterium gallinarum]MBE5039764.1 3-oxoacyl-ACP reductase FabG [Ructibacterium gallinarum]